MTQLYLIILLLFINNILLAEQCEPNNIVVNPDDTVWQNWFQTAEKYQSLEQYHNAIQTYNQALQKTSNPTKQAITLGSLGNACFMIGKTDKATKLLEKSLRQLEKLGTDLYATAIVLNNLGNLYTSKNEYNKAIACYEKSINLATQTDNKLLAIKAKLNFVQTALKDSSQLPIVKIVLLELLEQINTIKQAQIEIRLRLSRLMRQTYLVQPDYAEFKLKAFTILTEARQLAHEKQDAWGESQALGYLGQLYFDAGRYQEALQITNKAIMLADDDKFSHNTEILTYYWNWQIGKILKQQGKNSEAIAAYRQAVNELWSPSLRYDLAKIYRVYGSSFREQVGSLFLEFIDLLLKQADFLTRKDEQQIYFKEALDTLENLKAAELFDYFQAECVIDGKLDTAKIDSKLDITKVNEGEVVLYPIIFTNRIEILLYKSNEIIHVSSYIQKSDLDTKVLKFFDSLSRNDLVEKVEKYAEILYGILIRPIQNKLIDIETLIFVPDGKLRTIPIAALYDGNKYLIEKYAIVTVPSLTLRLPDTQSNYKYMLLASYSSIESNNPLPFLKTGVDNIENLFNKYGQTKHLSEQDFDKQHLTYNLETTNYSHIHIASHASFEANIEDSYLLIAKEKLPLNDLYQLLLLNRTHDSAINLIILHACETAQGDERAALGLGGLAHRAGIHSAVASLWTADDKFTSQFMPIFYEKLLQQNLSKAEALQQAQQRMWEIDSKYKNPTYWAAFILIGNWL